MKNNLRDTDNIYPGSYIPFLQEDEMEQVLNRPHQKELNFPAVNVIELSTSFKVEMAIPAIKRENLFVHADNNVLSVCVLRPQKDAQGEIKPYVEDTDYRCFDRHIILPENADAEFISAEYKNGILCMYAPKSKRPNNNLHTNIAVY